MRLSYVSSATLVVALALPSVLGAQSATSASRQATSPLIAARRESGPYAVTMAPIAVPAAAADAAPSTTRRVFRAVVGVGVGAAVGGWLGYFGAQVANSDWKRISADEKTELRQSYTAAGLGLGAVAGYFLRPKGRTVSRLPQPINVPPRTGRPCASSSWPSSQAASPRV